MDNRNFDTFNERFGYELEQLRRIHRIKQKDLAKRLNMAQATLSNIERGKSEMGLDTFRKLFDVFGSMLFYIFLLAHFNINLKEKVMGEHIETVQKLFFGWVQYLRDLGELVVFQTHYEKDKSRVD